MYQSSITVKNSQKRVKTAKMTIGVQSSHVYQDCNTVYQQCTNRQKQSKHSQNSTKMTIGVPVVTVMSTKTVLTVYQKQSKDSQNSKKMIISVPIVTGLPRLYQQCDNSLPIVNKNLAIANRSRVSCAHNTSRAFIGLNITP